MKTLQNLFLPVFLILITFSTVSAQKVEPKKTIEVDKITKGRTSDEKVYEYVVPSGQWVETELLIKPNQEVLIHHFASDEKVWVNLGGVTDDRLQKSGTILPLYTSKNCSRDPGVRAKVKYYCRQLKEPESVKFYVRQTVRVGIVIKNR